ncbi:hypothetical protein HMI54_001901 [Coelomomyces lativittatus]|nr:hypothetical protein HMI54_001901 [Coelomomyces lativittatus]KAJ1518451.1 hypothetical protein HMI55_000012 [Coelomomyces lativittatus]
MKKNAIRASRHIISFYQIYVKFDENTVLPVVVDSSQTIEYLRALVEAVYAFNFTMFATTPDKLENTLNSNTPSPFVKLPMIVALLCNEKFETLNFESKIEDILHHGDTIVIGACENFTLQEAVSHDGMRIEFPQHLKTQPTDQSTQLSTEKEFLSYLYNRKILSSFKDYCLSKTIVQDLLFWIEVEVFNSSSEEAMPVMGKYIFATYLLENAPLKINIPNELKQETIRLASGPCPIHAFDDAQLFIFNTMKCIVFPKFKTTPEFKTAISKDVNDYQIMIPFSTYFPSYDNLFSELIQQHDKYFDTEMPMYLKEMYLNRILNRYFPEAQPALDYFEIIQVVDQQKKNLKLQREKKLRKFFGVTASCSPSAQFHSPETEVALKLKHPWDLSGNLLNLSMGSDLDKSKNAPQIFLRKKRVEKLESFFGMKPDPSKNFVEENSPTETSRGLVKTNSLPILVNENEIPAELKQRLTKRSRKIRQMLGDGVESDLKTIMLENNNSNTISRRHTTPNTSNIDSNMDSTEFTDAATNSNELDHEDSVEKISKIHTFLADAPEKELSDNEVEEYSTRPLDTKEVKLKRRGKLQQLLGQGQLPPDSQVISPTHPRSLSLAQAERARRMRRQQSIKIEKVLGEVPTNYTLTNADRKLLAHQHFMATISMMLQRRDGLSRILTYLLQEHKVNPLPPLSPINTTFYRNLSGSTKDFDLQSQASSISTDSEKQEQQDKLRRQKKFQKLSKFFGGAVDPELLIEQKILSELERKIEEDSHNDDDSLYILKENLKLLRSQVKILVENFSEDDLALPSPSGDSEHSVGNYHESPSVQPS